MKTVQSLKERILQTVRAPTTKVGFRAGAPASLQTTQAEARSQVEVHLHDTRILTEEESLMRVLAVGFTPHLRQ